MHADLPVIQARAAEVRQTTQSLLSQLLHKLRSNIQLPECLCIVAHLRPIGVFSEFEMHIQFLRCREAWLSGIPDDIDQRNVYDYLKGMLPECLCIVAHLRRIGLFSEFEMHLQFLRCREAWLSGILDDIDQRNVYDYLKGMVNCHRMHLFDVVNQYRDIFNNDKSGSEENYDGGLLFSWAMHQIENHLSTFEVMLPKITEGGSLSNILDQCMYCAMGLGLVGLDFRGLLPPLFEDAVLNLFPKNMRTAVENFQGKMRKIGNFDHDLLLIKFPKSCA